MPSQMTLEQLVGQTLTIGVPGTKITPEIVRHFKELNAGGLILYRINFESPAQLKKMISDLESALGRRILVMADHEGGRVIMFRDGITVFPDNWAFGQTGKPKYARMQGEIESKELRRLGIDVNLGPVLDVLTDSYSPNIGIRSYGKDWKLVAEMGMERIRATQKGGISACAKHFPGKGHAPVDAHLGLPTIRSTWEEMENLHLQPFLKAIEAGIDMVMTSHPYYPNLDADPKNIATFSRKIVYDYLRTKLKYQGIICSDDLEMGAIKEICPIGEAGVRAMNAGHDILLVCHDLNAQREVYQSLVSAYKEGRCDRAELQASVARIQNLKTRRKKRFEGGSSRAESAGKAIAHSICEQGVKFFNESHSPRLPELKNKKVLVIFPQFSSLAQKIMIEKETAAEKQFVLKEFGRFGIRPTVQVVGIEPNDEEIAAAAANMKKHDVTVHFCFDAHLYASNKKLLEKVQDDAPSAVIGLLRDFYDISLIKPSIPVLTCGGWRACQIRSIIERIAK